MPRKMPGVYQRKDGRYVKELYIDGKRKCVYGATPAEVARKVKQLEEEVARGADIAKRTTRLAAFLQQWLDDVVVHRNRPLMQQAHRQIVRDHIVPTLGHMRLCDVTPQHVQAMLNKLATTHAPRTVRNVRATLRRAFNQAIAWRIVTFNPAQHVDVPQPAPDAHQFLTYEQARALLASVQGTEWYTLYWLTLELGLRRGEVLGLLVADVNLDAACVTLTGTIQKHAGKEAGRVGNTKMRDKPVVMPLSPMLVELLAPLVLGREGQCYVFGDALPLSGNKLAWWFKKHCAEAGVPVVRFHDLRHSCASFLIHQGEHPRLVMQHLRHSTITITMNTYGHLFPAEHRRASQAIGDALGQASPSKTPSSDGVSGRIPH